jgi:FkbM family methyltransferase
MKRNFLFFFLRDIRDLILLRKPARDELSGIGPRVVMYSRFIEKGDLVFDVGANLGNRIHPMLRLGARVVAVEPQEDCVSYLRYRFGKKISVIPKGAGAKSEMRVLYISGINTVSSFAEDWIKSVKEKRFSNIEWNVTREVEIVTLDSLIEQFGKPKFIKIDVEGFELEVLRGLSSPVPFISFEYTLPEQAENLFRVLTYLNGLGTDVSFNYSIGESMTLELVRWMNYDQFVSFVTSHSFIESSFGDVYVKYKMANLN